MDERQKSPRAKRLIDATFIDLLEEKGFYATRITEIIKRAEISRTTFYAHYQDKYELIAEMRDTMLNGFIDTMKGVRQKGIINVRNYDYGSAPLHTEYFLYVQQNARLWSIFLAGKGESDFSQRFTSKIADFLYDTSNIWEPTDPHMPKEVASNIGAWTTVGLISSWVSGGMREPPQEMGRHLALFWKRILSW